MINNRPKFSEISLEKRMLTEIPSLFLTEYLSYIIEYQFLDYTLNADLNGDLKLEEIDLSDITVYFSDNFRAVIICINVRGMKRFFLALPANIIYYDLENLKLFFKKELEDYLSYFYESGDYNRYKELKKQLKDHGSSEEYENLKKKNKSLKLYKKMNPNAFKCFKVEDENN